MTVHHWPPRPGLSRARAQARADVMRMLAGTGIQHDPGDENDHPSVSVHTMQQQPRREDHLEYYARRAREAQAQSDARKGEAYDDDLDTWRRPSAKRKPCKPGDVIEFQLRKGETLRDGVARATREHALEACAICGREGLTVVTKSEPDERGWHVPVMVALCGPMGRVAA